MYLNNKQKTSEMLKKREKIPVRSLNKEGRGRQEIQIRGNNVISLWSRKYHNFVLNSVLFISGDIDWLLHSVSSKELSMRPCFDFFVLYQKLEIDLKKKKKTRRG